MHFRGLWYKKDYIKSRKGNLPQKGWVDDGQVCFNPLPTIHVDCHLLSHLLMYSRGLYYKQYGPRLDSDQGPYCLLPS